MVYNSVRMALMGKSLRGCCEEIASQYFNAPFIGNCLHARCVYEVRGRNLPIPFQLRHHLIMFFMRRAMKKYPATIGE